MPSIKAIKKKKSHSSSSSRRSSSKRAHAHHSIFSISIFFFHICCFVFSFCFILFLLLLLFCCREYQSVDRILTNTSAYFFMERRVLEPELSSLIHIFHFTLFLNDIYASRPTEEKRKKVNVREWEMSRSKKLLLNKNIALSRLECVSVRKK